MAVSTKSSSTDSEVRPNRMGKTVVDMRSMLRNAIRDGSSEIQDHQPEDRLLKPLAAFTGYSSEMRDLAAVVARVGLLSYTKLS